MEELKRAIEFAMKAHYNQVRKFTGIPYITHCTAGVRYLSNCGIDNETMFVAMTLHDVVEDSKYTIDDIRKKFGDIVATIVAEVTLTKKDKKDKGAFLKNLADNGTNEAVIIKAVDRITNTEDFFLQGDTKKSQDYAREATPVFARAAKLNGRLASAIKRLARLIGLDGYALFQIVK